MFESQSRFFSTFRALNVWRQSRKFFENAGGKFKVTSSQLSDAGYPLRIQHRYFGQPAAQTHPHLVRNGHVTPGITAEEYRMRRQKLMEAIAKNSKTKQDGGFLVIVPSSPKTYMTYDIPYPFRQNTDFFYLCGFLEPDSVLILEAKSMADLPDHNALLFVPKRDPLRERWDGPRSGIDGAMLLTGVDAAFNNNDLGYHLDSYISNTNLKSVWYESVKPSHIDFHNQYFNRFLAGCRSKSVESPQMIMQSLRIIKSPAEIELMKQTCQVASESMSEVMKFSRPQMSEALLYAKMDFECRIRGADYLAYPPVVAGGERANIIHYVANNQLIGDGELVLMDAGCEYHGYTSDMTRTWPVSGTFSRAQRELYEALLEVQESCVRLCTPGGISANQLYVIMLSHIGHQLQRLGLVSKSKSSSEVQNLAREFCPHHVSHYLGIDVHDTDSVSRTITLRPGMVVTVEPGLYIEKSRTDVPAEFRGIGMRIEDDILITDSGPYNLCSHCPKHPDDIEKTIRGS